MTESERKEVIQVVKAPIEICSGAAHLAVAMHAKSIQRAPSIVATRYPASLARVNVPLEPDGFFLEDSADRVAPIEPTTHIGRS